MPDRLTQEDRYRKVATEASNLAKSASSDFLRRYYERLAERYLLLAEGELRLSEREITQHQMSARSPAILARESVANITTALRSR